MKFLRSDILQLETLSLKDFLRALGWGSYLNCFL